MSGIGADGKTIVERVYSAGIDFDIVDGFAWKMADGFRLLSELEVITSGAGVSGVSGISADGRTVIGANYMANSPIRAWTLDIGTPPQTHIVAAVAPNARTTAINTPVTGFATIINAGSVAANQCLISIPTVSPSIADFLFQTTDPGSNMPVGTLNQSIDIPASAAQTFYFAITPHQKMSADIPLSFTCGNAAAAPRISGLTTFSLSADNVPIADMISAEATIAGGGVMEIIAPDGVGLIAVAAINIRAAAAITVAPTDTPLGKPPRNLPLSLSICQVDPGDGHCINPPSPAASATVSVANQQTVYFSTFVKAQGQVIPFDPANNRIFILAMQDSTPVGETSAAVKFVNR